MTYLTRVFGRSDAQADRPNGDRSGLALFLLLALVFVPIVGAHIAAQGGVAVAAPAEQATARR